MGVLTISMIVSLLIMPLLILAFSLLWKKRPPKQMNCLYGYRTRRSFASQDAWDFAHAYFARVGTWISAASLAGTVVGAGLALAFRGADGLKTAALTLFPMQIAAVLTPIFLTESALRKRFQNAQ